MWLQVLESLRQWQLESRRSASSGDVWGDNAELLSNDYFRSLYRALASVSTASPVPVCAVRASRSTHPPPPP